MDFLYLNVDNSLPVAFVAGAVYHVRIGEPGRLTDEARNVWSFLRQALYQPLGLILDPLGDPGLTPLSELHTATPTGDTCESSFLTLFSSGTTGIPKPRTHRLHEVFARKRVQPGDATWLLAYSPYRWAGLSVMLHVLNSQSTEDRGQEYIEHPTSNVQRPEDRGRRIEDRGRTTNSQHPTPNAGERCASCAELKLTSGSHPTSGARLIVPPSLVPEVLVAAAQEGQVTHLSLTPSYLRTLKVAVGREALASIPLRQLTFGGEAATQPVLDAAKAIWPEARITHVYASTERGDICAVSDGLEGIPETKFAGKEYAFTPAGELVIDGFATGDLWDRRAGRYHFLGREQEMINVGGAKVSPIAIETAALQVEGVTGARAYGVPSALLGQMVGLEYCGDLAEVELRKALRSHLPKVAWPAVLQRVPAIAVNGAGKTERGTKP